MARRTARKSRRKSRKSKRRGRRSRRQRGGNVAATASPVQPEPEKIEDASPEEVDSGKGQAGGKRKRKSKTAKKQKGGKRKLNAFFKAMLAAKKSKAKSFKYKGKTYKGRKHHRLGMIYSKA